MLKISLSSHFFISIVINNFVVYILDGPGGIVYLCVYTSLLIILFEFIYSLFFMIVIKFFKLEFSF